jgi:hypothetical protein
MVILEEHSILRSKADGQSADVLLNPYKQKKSRDNNRNIFKGI